MQRVWVCEVLKPAAFRHGLLSLSASLQCSGLTHIVRLGMVQVQHLSKDLSCDLPSSFTGNRTMLVVASCRL